MSVPTATKSGIVTPVRGRQTAVRLFWEMAERVPAYNDFLKKHRFNPRSVTTASDFPKIPVIDKDNYLRQYPLEMLSWDGDLSSTRMISVSSGSTGRPFFWPHGRDQHREGTLLHKYIYDRIFGISDKKTLVVICFSMGTWIAGPFTLLSTIGVSDHHEVLNTISPGIEKEDAVQAIKNLAGNYEKIIIAGYPPFVKDVIDESMEAGIKWKQHDVSLLLAGEAISEEWRNYILEEIGSRDRYHDTSLIYGTADATILGHETPYSILLRRMYNNRPKLMRETFNTSVLPTLVQYYPELRYFEQIGDELIFTARAGIPLCRYNIHDSGRVLTPAEVTEPLKGVLPSRLKATNIRWLKFWSGLPFVSLNGRKDFTVTLYGLLVYPENIKAALIKPQLRSFVSGKFVVSTEYDKQMEQYLDIQVELKQGHSATAARARAVTSELVRTMMRVNAEYRKLHRSLGSKANPQVALIKKGEPPFDGSGPKHRWSL